MVIGYTTGVFDMFHIGHLNILKQAKEHCDYLIVGVSTDELVQSYKNKTPIIPFNERKAIVESCCYVDKVVPQEDRDKIAAYERIKFDIMFVGDDWKGKPLFNEVEAYLNQHGAKVIYFPYTKGTSSTILRQKLLGNPPKTGLINFAERQKLQLDMLAEIDAFCREHNIRYMLDSGTLIGAVRHKGYIPWDDDVDIAMPKDDLLRFKKEFVSENLKYCDVDTEPYFETSFSRVSMKHTYQHIVGKLNIDGVCIDLHPVFEMPDDMATINRFLKNGKRTRVLRQKADSLRRMILSRIPLRTIPFFKTIIKYSRNYVFKYPAPSKDSKYLYFHCGPFDHRYIFDFNPFDNIIYTDFEGLKMPIPAEYDRFLSHKYGDYMTLPPEEQRVPYHGGEFHWGGGNSYNQD